MSLDSAILSEPAEFRQLLGELDALRPSLAERSPFGSKAWLCSASEHAVASSRLAVATVRESGRLLAAAPMQVRPGRFARVPVRELGFLGDPFNDRGAFLYPAGRTELVTELLSASFDRGPRFDVVRLTELHEDSPALAAIRVFAKERGLRCVARTCSRAPHVRVEGDWDAFHSGTSKNLRGQLRNKRNRLARQGPVEFLRVRPDAAELDGLWPELAEVERLSWKGDERTGVLSPPHSLPFFRSALLALADSGGIDLGLLRVGDRLAAYHLGLLHEDGFYSYSLAQPTEFDPCSPGTLLMNELLRDSFERGMRRVDASRGDLKKPHLLHRYPGEVRAHLTVVLFTARPAAQVARSVRFSVRPLLKGAEAEWSVWA